MFLTFGLWEGYIMLTKFGIQWLQLDSGANSHTTVLIVPYCRTGNYWNVPCLYAWTCLHRKVRLLTDVLPWHAVRKQSDMLQKTRTVGHIGKCIHPILWTEPWELTFLLALAPWPFQHLSDIFCRHCFVRSQKREDCVYSLEPGTFWKLQHKTSSALGSWTLIVCSLRWEVIIRSSWAEAGMKEDWSCAVYPLHM